MSSSFTTAPIVISVAPNGARKTKKDHPNLPITPEEIAAEASRCYKAGARVIHLHVRDDAHQHTLSVEKYQDAIAAIRQTLGNKMIIQATTEACGIFSPKEQMEMVQQLRPEAVSIALKEIAPEQSDEPRATEFFTWMKENNIHPQYILYSSDELERFIRLCDQGIIPGARHTVLFVLGRYHAQQRSTPNDLIPFIATCRQNNFQQNIMWSVCAFGSQEHACMTTAALLGGHPRIGFENNLYLADGSTAQDNSALIRQFTTLAETTGRPIATTEEARQLFLT